jgi:hypothetical protein
MKPGKIQKITLDSTRTIVACRGHVFVPFKSEESICWSCGFVTWKVHTSEDAELALLELEGGACPGVWHGQQTTLTMGE